MKGRWRTVVTVGFIIMLLVPAAGTGDSVPLSSYPMYAGPRSPEISFVVPVGQRVNGSDVALSPSVIAGSTDPLIVESYLRREIEGGRQQPLCLSIASRVVDSRIVSIEIRLERFNVVDRVLGEKPSLSSALLASCSVP